MKKIFVSLLASLLCLTCLAACTGGSPTPTDLTCTVSADGTYAEVTDCLYNATEVEIPSTYKGRPVTSIGEKAFENCTFLTSVTIPDSVTSIGQYAFESCNSLTSIVIPDSVIHIGNHAFYSSNLASITLPSGIESIGEGMFLSTNLTGIVIPDGVTSIDEKAFYACDRLTSITIPASVTSIGEQAFAWCELLEIINYGGTKSQWNAITKGSGWDSYAGEYIVTCTDGAL